MIDDSVGYEAPDIEKLNGWRVLYSPNSDSQVIEGDKVREYLVDTIVKLADQINAAKYLFTTGVSIIINLDEEQYMMLKLMLPDDIILGAPYDY